MVSSSLFQFRRLKIGLAGLYFSEKREGESTRIFFKVLSSFSKNNLYNFLYRNRFLQENLFRSVFFLCRGIPQIYEIVSFGLFSQKSDNYYFDFQFLKLVIRMMRYDKKHFVNPLFLVYPPPPFPQPSLLFTPLNHLSYTS